MKTIFHSTLIIATVVAGLNLRAAETNTVPAHIGVYDSRAVAYVWFTSSNHLAVIREMMHSAKQAKATGNTNLYNELAVKLPQMQEAIHREVFGTAPAVEAMAEIKDRLPEIQSATGVTALVSKWDDATLKQYPDAQQMDVTDQLVQEFKPTAQQLKTLSDIEKHEPVPMKSP
jgi:hypothetical protein